MNMSQNELLADELNCEVDDPFETGREEFEALWAEVQSCPGCRHAEGNPCLRHR